MLSPDARFPATSGRAVLLAMRSTIWRPGVRVSLDEYGEVEDTERGEEVTKQGTKGREPLHEGAVRARGEVSVDARCAALVRTGSSALGARSAVGLKSASTVVIALSARSAVGAQSASTVVGALSARSAVGHQSASTVVGALSARSAAVHQSASTVVGALNARSAVGLKSASTVVSALSARSAVGLKSASTVVSL